MTEWTEIPRATKKEMRKYALREMKEAVEGYGIMNPVPTYTVYVSNDKIWHAAKIKFDFAKYVKFDIRELKEAL
jgi:hypothetical protein